MLALIFPVVLFLFSSGHIHAKDQFQNFEELTKVAQEGIDYQVYVVDNESPVTALAIHGGKIEPYSEALAKEIASSEGYNLYTFEAVHSSSGGLNLHLTSTNFDDPRAVTLVKKSKLSLSFHGMVGSDEEVLELGGTSKEYLKKIARELRKKLPEIITHYPSKLFPGTSPRNIANRTKEGGIQLEMSLKLRRHLQSDEAFRKLFLNVLATEIRQE